MYLVSALVATLTSVFDYNALFSGVTTEVSSAITAVGPAAIILASGLLALTVIWALIKRFAKSR